MNRIIIIHSQHVKESREFIAQYSQYQVLNWHIQSEVSEYISAGMPAPAQFPAVVDTELKMISYSRDNPTITAQNLQVEFDQIKLRQLKARRDYLLSISDYVVLPDSPASDACKAAYITYRQVLRDLPLTWDINNVVFPTPPAFEKRPN